jgi:hypothetical protein
MKHILYIVTFLIYEIKCNILINIEMNAFTNPNGIKIGNKLCRLGKDNKCLTSFRFCITSLEEDNQCLSEFQTQVIGENSIYQDQFKLTTDLIQFPITSFQINKNFILIIEVLNNDIDSSKSLISRWTFKLFDKLSIKNKWTNFYQTNSELNQRISFNFKAECSSNYNGFLCEKRKNIF